MHRNCSRPPSNPRLRLVTPIPRAPNTPGTLIRRRALGMASACASATFVVWASAGMVAAGAFFCVASSVVLAVLNRAQRSCSSTPEGSRSSEL